MTGNFRRIKTYERDRQTNDLCRHIQNRTDKRQIDKEEQPEKEFRKIMRKGGERWKESAKKAITVLHTKKGGRGFERIATD